MQDSPENSPDVSPCCVDEQHVRAVRARMIDPGRMEELAAFFRMLGAASRVGILYALSVEPEMCVGDLAALLDMAQPAVSNQLKALRQARLIRSRRDGKMIFYSLADQHPKDIIRYGLEHLDESGE